MAERQWHLGSGVVMHVGLPFEPGKLNRAQIAKLRRFVDALEVEAAIGWDEEVVETSAESAPPTSGRASGAMTCRCGATVPQTCACAIEQQAAIAWDETTHSNTPQGEKVSG